MQPASLSPVAVIALVDGVAVIALVDAVVVIAVYIMCMQSIQINGHVQITIVRVCSSNILSFVSEIALAGLKEPFCFCSKVLLEQDTALYVITSTSDILMNYTILSILCGKNKIQKE